MERKLSEISFVAGVVLVLCRGSMIRSFPGHFESFDDKIGQHKAKIGLLKRLWAVYNKGSTLFIVEKNNNLRFLRFWSVGPAPDPIAIFESE